MSCPFTGNASELDEALTDSTATATTANPEKTEKAKAGKTATSKGAKAPRTRKQMRRDRRNDRVTRADEGFFGPDSIAWKVWSFPGFALQAFARAVTIEHLDPDLVAAVDDSGQVYKRTPVRYDRTMEYFAAVMTSDAQTMTRMSDILMKVHDRSYGENPVTGNDYEANKPESQMWILVTAWHSMLYIYETFGPGKLSRDEENEYWEQMGIAGSFQPIRLEDLPKTRGEVQKYFDDWRPKLSASEAAIRNTDHIIDGFKTIEPDLPKWFIKVGRPVLRKSIIATYPRWMRPMLGVKQSRLMDSLSIAVWKPIYKVLDANPRLFLWLLGRICPRAVRYMAPLVMDIPAGSPKVYTPEVARRMYGNPLTPLEQREELLRKRQEEGVAQKAYDHNHTDQILEFRAADSEEDTEETLESTKAYEAALEAQKKTG
ncbi:MAG: oxygenase MpaB family protein [Mycobacteriaceae bacterium]|uniref:oxygenase MpaB family protein n=1 Tax=Corynebacterium sp. TaxID=1720 RepID=UPI003F972663